MFAGFLISLMLVVSPEVTVTRTGYDGVLRSTGSGTVVGKRQILTVKHFVNSGTAAGKIVAKFSDGKTVPMTAAYVAVGDDLCLLESTTDLPATPAILAPDAAGVGQAVWQNGLWGHKTGVVKDVQEMTLLTTILATQGDSGAAVFDGANKITGVAWGIAEGTQYATPLSRIRRLIEKPETRWHTTLDAARAEGKSVVVVYVESDGCVNCYRTRQALAIADLGDVAKCVLFGGQGTGGFPVTAYPSVIVGGSKPGDPGVLLSGSQVTVPAVKEAIEKLGR